MADAIVAASVQVQKYIAMNEITLAMLQYIMCRFTTSLKTLLILQFVEVMLKKHLAVFLEEKVHGHHSDQSDLNAPFDFPPLNPSRKVIS